MSLVKKLKELKYTAQNSKFGKRAATLALSGMLAISTLACAVGCGETTNPNTPGNNSGTTQPGGENPSYNPKYSQILNDVLNSDYYNGLIDDLNNPNIEVGPAAQDIPFNFLQKEGFDVEKIKSNKYYVESGAYFKEDNKNDMYFRIMLTEKTDEAVSTIYNLKYTVTDKEYEDLKMLNSGDYIQSTFFIQELDKQKNATIISKNKIYEKSYNDLLTALNKDVDVETLFGGKQIASFAPISIKSDKEDERKYYLTIDAISNNNSTSSISNREISTIDITLPWSAGASFNADNFKINRSSYIIKSTSEPIEITYFSPDSGYIYKNNFIN